MGGRGSIYDSDDEDLVEPDEDADDHTGEVTKKSEAGNTDEKMTFEEFTNKFGSSSKENLTGTATFESKVGPRPKEQSFQSSWTSMNDIAVTPDKQVRFGSLWDKINVSEASGETDTLTGD